MLTRLERFGVFISLLLIFALVAGNVLRPDWSRPAAIAVSGVGFGLAIAFTLRRNWSRFRDGQLTRAQLWWCIARDLLGLALVVGVASYLGGVAGAWSAARLGFWAGLLTGMLVGFGTAWCVGWGWRRLTARAGAGRAGGA